MSNTSRMYSWYFTQYEDLEDQIWTMIHQIASLMLYQMCYQYWQIFILILIDFDMLDGYYIYIYLLVNAHSKHQWKNASCWLYCSTHMHLHARARAFTSHLICWARARHWVHITIEQMLHAAYILNETKYSCIVMMIG